MPDWVIYNTTTNRVKRYEKSSPIDPTYPVGAGEGAVKDPNVTALSSVPIKYWKQVSGSIQEMTSTEKTQVDADLENARKVSARARIDAGTLLPDELMLGLDDLSKDSTVTSLIGFLGELSAAKLKARIKKVKGL